MESRTFLLLEFPKILDALAACCRSDPGRRASRAVAPVMDAQEIGRLQLHLHQAMAWAEESRADCPAFPDLAGVLSYVLVPSRNLDLDAVWAIGRFIAAARQVRTSLTATEALRWPDLQEQAAACPWPEMVASALKRCVSDDGQLKDESSPELWSVRREIRHIHQQCTRKVKDFVTEQGIGGYLQDDFMTISSDRYVLPLKSNFKGKVSGIIHDYSQTGETCYIEPLFLVEINNRLQELKQEEREAEARILAYLTDTVRREIDALGRLHAWLVDMDLLLAKVRLARQMQAVPIEVACGGELHLKMARHPLLVLAGHPAKPVTIELKGAQRVLIISGGNAGGKTVALKTAGLLALMAMSGLPVPVDEGSTLPLWRDIQVFMGDEQSLEGQLSTFSAQISHVAAVWERIDENSLVLLDEFGAGTDPSQGAALAQAVVDGLLDKGAWALVATHFPALKAYALTKEGVRSASVLFDPKTKKPLYSLAYDQVGASQAMEVAREYGLPESILVKAQHYLLLDGADTTKLIERLNALTVDREEELAAVREQRTVLAEQKAKLKVGFERDKTALLQEIKKQAQDVLARLRDERISRRQALRELGETRKKLVAKKDSEAPATVHGWEDFQVGDRVAYPAWNKHGIIQEKDERRKSLKVELGGVSLWLPHQEVTPTKANEAGPQGLAFRAAESQAASLQLDLRGLRADEALSRLGAFLDRAILRGATRVEVVHGRGTGALRREVQQFLKGFPAVASHVLANEDEGGDGMTVVTLR